MSAPKILIQIVIVGGRIFGKALLEAGRQAIKNAKYRPAEVNQATGIGNATSGSITDTLSRDHRMTLDEAHLILNLKKGESMEKVLQNYEHLFKANSAPQIDPPPSKNTPLVHSHYLQSKVVRAKERLEAEYKLALEERAADSPPSTTSTSTSQPPS
ncbi:Pam16-domain-containing protein [Cantharellus anzutake]|uniref:Pam16-domain-containing protein n=1 Tax=Cantharellus anzutake TaxID=1750568 RepID=UPI001906558C|nr:Pam16-domain-containing protein [Cantharellus anzutake]KAF8342197.1 Pam16-domain-containing protein [Cantharellus anzutake]